MFYYWSEHLNLVLAHSSQKCWRKNLRNLFQKNFFELQLKILRYYTGVKLDFELVNSREYDFDHEWIGALCSVYQSTIKYTLQVMKKTLRKLQLNFIEWR